MRSNQPFRGARAHARIFRSFATGAWPARLCPPPSSPLGPDLVATVTLVASGQVGALAELTDAELTYCSYSYSDLAVARPYHMGQGEISPGTQTLFLSRSKLSSTVHTLIIVIRLHPSISLGAVRLRGFDSGLGIHRGCLRGRDTIDHSGVELGRAAPDRSFETLVHAFQHLSGHVLLPVLQREGGSG